MRSTLSAFLAAAALVAALGLALAAPHAVSADGAQPTGGSVNVNDCTDDGSSTVCYTAQGEQHGVCTPSSGCNTQFNLQSECLTITDDATGALLYQGCEWNFHEQFHTDKTNDVQVAHVAFDATIHDNLGQTYCWSAQYHASNGQVQYDRLTYTC